MLLVLLVALAIGVALLVMAVKPRRAEPNIRPGLCLSDVPESLNWFLREAGEASVFLLERESGDGFLQFRVMNRKDNRLDVDFGLPDAEWCRGHFDSTAHHLERAGHFCVVKSHRANEAFSRFMTVRLRGTPDELKVRMGDLLREVAPMLGFAADERYTLQMTTTISADYLRDLANQLERSPRAGRLPRRMASWLREWAARRDESGP